MGGACTTTLQKSEHMQYSPYLFNIVKKYSTLIDLTQPPKYADNPHLLVKSTADRINKSVIKDDKRRPTQITIFVDDNLLEGIWTHLKPALA